jgi:hypothetical protein
MVSAISEEIVGGPGLSNKDAKLLHELVNQIRKDRGHLKSEDLFEEIIKRSRPKKSPTHHLYEWDLEKGHALYLLERTRRLVMKVEIIFAKMPKTRAWRGVVIEGVRGPAPIQKIISVDHLFESVLDEARAALEMWARKYKELENLAEFRDVFQTINKW